MKVCKQAEHCAYMVRMIADRCEDRITRHIMGLGTARATCSCDGQLHDQIVAARRELLALDKAIQDGRW